MAQAYSQEVLQLVDKAQGSAGMLPNRSFYLKLQGDKKVAVFNFGKHKGVQQHVISFVE